MEREEIVKLLKSKDQSVEKPSDPNPYSQDELSKFITSTGFDVEQTPKLSELAKLLNKQKLPLAENEVTIDKDEKNPISTVRKHLIEKDEDSDPVDKQLSIKALKKLIAKYKNEEM